MSLRSPLSWVDEGRTAAISQFSLASGGANLGKTGHGGENASGTSAETSNAASIGSPNAGLLEEIQQQDLTAPHENEAAARASGDDDAPIDATPHEPKIWTAREGRNCSARRRNERVSQPNLGRESSAAKRNTRRRKTTASGSNREYGVEGRGRTSGGSGGGSSDGDGKGKVGAIPHHLQVGRKCKGYVRYGGGYCSGLCCSDSFVRVVTRSLKALACCPFFSRYALLGKTCSSKSGSE